MALVKTYSDTAATKTHGLVDGTLVDLVNPTKALDSTGEFLRAGIFAVGGWLGRGYKENRTIGF